MSDSLKMSREKISLNLTTVDPSLRARTGYTLDKELRRMTVGIERAIRKHAPDDPILPENAI